MKTATTTADVPASVIDATGILADNWNHCSEGAPPVIVNPAASEGALIAWCWAEAKALSDMAAALDSIEGLDGGAVTSLFHHRLWPLANVLEHLGDKAKYGPGGGSA